MIKSGIYCIINLKNGKRYVGSAVDIKKRWNNHRCYLNNCKHHSRYLQRAWDKYGEDNFLFSILEECSREDLIVKEQHWLDFFQCYKKKNGYNICSRADNTLGVKMTEGQRRKMSNAQQGRFFSEEHRKKLSESGKGRILSEESKKKMSVSLKEYYRNRSGPMKGKNHSEETKEKMSENHIDFSGEKNGRAKLSWEKVQEIREKYSTNNYTYRSLAEEYGVTHRIICLIINNKIWRRDK